MRSRLVLRIVLAALLAGAITWAFTQRSAVDPAEVEGWVQGHGVSAPLVFIAIYAAATVLFVPGTVVTLAGGMLFGPVWGFSTT